MVFKTAGGSSTNPAGWGAEVAPTPSGEGGLGDDHRLWGACGNLGGPSSGSGECFPGAARGDAAQAELEESGRTVLDLEVGVSGVELGVS